MRSVHGGYWSPCELSLHGLSLFCPVVAAFILGALISELTGHSETTMSPTDPIVLFGQQTFRVLRSWSAVNKDMAPKLRKITCRLGARAGKVHWAWPTWLTLGQETRYGKWANKAREDTTCATRFQEHFASLAWQCKAHLGG